MVQAKFPFVVDRETLFDCVRLDNSICTGVDENPPANSQSDSPPTYLEHGETTRFDCKPGYQSDEYGAHAIGEYDDSAYNGYYGGSYFNAPPSGEYGSPSNGGGYYGGEYDFSPSNSVTRECNSGVLQDLGSCGRECADIDAVSLPANTLAGGCGAWMSIYHGSACHLACTSGYDGNPRLSCDDGTLTVLGSCVENVCSAATVSSNPGGTYLFSGSNCGTNTNGLADGENCTFTCEDYSSHYGSEYGSPEREGETVTRTCNSDGTVTDDVDCSDPYSDGGSDFGDWGPSAPVLPGSYNTCVDAGVDGWVYTGTRYISFSNTSPCDGSCTSGGSIGDTDDKCNNCIGSGDMGLDDIPCDGYCSVGDDTDPCYKGFDPSRRRKLLDHDPAVPHAPTRRALLAQTDKKVYGLVNYEFAYSSAVPDESITTIDESIKGECFDSAWDVFTVTKMCARSASDYALHVFKADPHGQTSTSKVYVTDANGCRWFGNAHAELTVPQKATAVGQPATQRVYFTVEPGGVGGGGECLTETVNPKVDFDGKGAHACAVLDDDSLRCWGSNAFGQLGAGAVEREGLAAPVAAACACAIGLRRVRRERHA